MISTMPQKRPDQPPPSALFNAHAAGFSPQDGRKAYFTPAPVWASVADDSLAIRQPREETLFEKIQGQLSGYVMQSDMINVGTNEITEAEKKKKERDLKSFGEALSPDSVWSVENVVESLSDGIERDKALLRLNENFREVTGGQILRLNAKGEADPSGDVVQTIQQKRDYENRTRACTALYAQEEVTMAPDGRLMLVETMESDMRLQENIQRREEAIRNVQDGTVSTQNLDPVLKNEVMERHKARTAPSSPGITVAAAPDPTLETNPEQPGIQALSLQNRPLAPMPSPI